MRFLPLVGMTTEKILALYEDVTFTETQSQQKNASAKSERSNPKQENQIQN